MNTEVANSLDVTPHNLVISKASEERANSISE